jgi:uncharacterized membrane protein HdeD (DUF308 family)
MQSNDNNEVDTNNIEKLEEEKLIKQQQKRDSIKKKVNTRHKRKPYKIPFWLRIVNILFGFVQIGIAGFVLIDPEDALEFTYLLIAIIFVIIGTLRMVNSIFEKQMKGYLRITNLILGVLFIFSAIGVLVNTEFADQVALYLFSGLLIIQGITRLLAGITKKYLPIWYRLVTSIIGISSILIPIFVLILKYSNSIEDTNLILLLFLIVLFNGIGRLLKGIAGLHTKKVKSAK